LVGALLWAAASLYLARHWLGDLANHIGVTLAWVVIFGIAIIPGFMNAFLLVSLAVDRRPKHTPLKIYPPITILIAAYNEAANIVETIQSIALQHYSGELEVIVINDGSTDATSAVVAAQCAVYPWLKLLDLDTNRRKAKALNEGLAQAQHDFVMTLDADCYLYTAALQHIVERYMQDTPNTRVVAGTVLVRNSRESWITRAQEWDYFHGIAAIKRSQSLFQGTLVAQGAFSLYDRGTLIAMGGWPDCGR